MALLIALFLALASLMQISNDDTRIESEAADTGSASGETNLDSSSQGEPVEASPSGPRTSIPYQLDGTNGTISCFRATSGAYSGSFVVQVVSATPVPEEMTVGVDLVAEGGTYQRQAVAIPTRADQGEVVVAVPDSVGTDGTEPLVDCTIAAIQKGQRVILTGS